MNARDDLKMRVVNIFNKPAGNNELLQQGYVGGAYGCHQDRREYVSTGIWGVHQGSK